MNDEKGLEYIAKQCIFVFLLMIAMQTYKALVSIVLSLAAVSYKTSGLAASFFMELGIINAVVFFCLRSCTFVFLAKEKFHFRYSFAGDCYIKTMGPPIC
ncbi:hypothetical protein [Polycladidibacter hongkongensis]|uniref:hypothetical protein n=1 Tax=Polycladidibacter hongkongensis TaxID=1647556 RepID=UPI0008324A5A|nr:hypothetical protein [Pseudovibrio hongkongensis]